MFNGATNDEKKMILARMVLGITASKEYIVDVEFLIAMSHELIKYCEAAMEQS